ncbi:MAG: histidine phosphatase family protein [Micropruina sp.]|uniref:SixA phosphatase family protein n=1 Tax=Micropruina sp. TaxID=2737536 RepID=UPI0039E2C686
MHTLIVMRHAKSSWSTSEPDHRRPLAGRGIRDATVAGQILSDYRLDRVLSSSSARTRQTWQTAALGGAVCDDVEFTDTLYGAWTDSVIGLLNELDESVGTALVLGHEPTMSSVVEWLAEPSELADEASGHFPTCAMAIFEVPGSWAGLAPGAARLVRFEIPRG